MVRGIDKFREFFTGYEGNYVIIGGTACEMYEEIYAQTPRATKDIDIILIVEALSSDFAAKFWEFVKTAGYRQRNKGTGNGECRHEYYRFKEPGNPDFPCSIFILSYISAIASPSVEKNWSADFIPYSSTSIFLNTCLAFSILLSISISFVYCG